MSAQQKPREMIRGKLVSDGMIIENVNVKNLNTNLSSISDELGYFTIAARANDTLLLSGVNFKPGVLVVKQLDMDVETMTIQLNLSVEELDEVVVNSLSGNLEKDSKRMKVKTINNNILGNNNQTIIDKKYVGDQQSSVKNRTMPADGSIEDGLDFVRIFKTAGRALGIGKNDKKKTKQYVSPKIFPEAVKEKFTTYFFRDVLQLKDTNETALFLAFAESDPKAKPLLAPDKEFELIDFLIDKRKEFQKK